MLIYNRILTLGLRPLVVWIVCLLVSHGASAACDINEALEVRRAETVINHTLNEAGTVFCTTNATRVLETMTQSWQQATLVANAISTNQNNINLVLEYLQQIERLFAYKDQATEEYVPSESRILSMANFSKPENLSVSSLVTSAQCIRADAARDKENGGKMNPSTEEYLRNFIDKVPVVAETVAKLYAVALYQNVGKCRR